MAESSRPAPNQGPPAGGYGFPNGSSLGYGQPYAPGVTPPNDPELARLKASIERLQKIHLVLFLVSLALLVASWAVTFPFIGHVAWAATLGGAVIARVRRSSLVAKYNARAMGGNAPIV